jgi:hypothetical protein
MKGMINSSKNNRKADSFAIMYCGQVVESDGGVYYIISFYSSMFFRGQSLLNSCKILINFTIQNPLHNLNYGYTICMVIDHHNKIQ